MKQEKNLTIVTIKIKTIIILTVTIITLIAFATVLKLTNPTNINFIITNAVTATNENNLSILRLNRAGMLPDFNPNIKEYYIIVGEEINNLEVTAVPENEDNKIVIEGNDNLENGLNTITVRVTSKNNISEEYKIYVTKTSSKEEANADLENLAVEGYTLAPNFQNQVLNYTLEIDKENIDKLNILAIPENYDAKVEIKGNENIKLNSQKENIVTIIVTASNGFTFQKYQIVINKKVEESINNSENNEEDDNNLNEQNKINDNEISIERLSNSKEIELSQKQKLEILIKQNSITILGILASIAVLGIVVILVYRKTKT